MAAGALSGMELPVSPMRPDHSASFTLAPGSLSSCRLPSAFPAGTGLLCGFHFSTWCPDCKLQEMTMPVLPKEQRDHASLYLNPRNGPPPPHRPLLPSQPTSAQAVTVLQEASGGCCAQRLWCRAGNDTPLTPGLKKTVEREQGLIWNASKQDG